MNDNRDYGDTFGPPDVRREDAEYRLHFPINFPRRPNSGKPNSITKLRQPSNGTTERASRFCRPFTTADIRTTGGLP